MNVTCDQCHKRYVIADDKVRGKSLKIRCRHCGSVMSVEGPGARPPVKAEPRPEEPRPSSPSATIWYAMVKKQQVGPLDAKALEAKVAAGEISKRTFVWRPGMSEWKRAPEVPELAHLFAASSPNPAAAAAPAPQKPAPPKAAPQQAADPLGELFSDANLPDAAQTFDETPLDGHSIDDEPETRKEPVVEDPFAALGEPDLAKLGPAGESTMFFINQAGVNKRNPPWKIAAVVAGLIVVPLALLWVLSATRLVPLEVTRVNESGEEVTESVFSPGGVSGIRDLLAGKRKAEHAKGEAKAPPKVAAKPPEPAKPKGGAAGGPTPEDLAKLYADSAKVDTGPRVRKDVEERPKDTTTGALSQESISKVVNQSQSAFQQCIEQELRKNPGFRGGRINIVATVGSSGVVKRAEIDRREIDASDLGGCLKRRAKQMQFSAFSGEEEAEVHIPLILSATL